MSSLDREAFGQAKRLSAESKQLQSESEESLAQMEELVREAKALVCEAKALQGSCSGQAPVIHVVDDDEHFVTAISRVLKVAGYSVRSYQNARNFLVAPVEKDPGCILLDYRLPGLSGLELQNRLGARTDVPPIIFLSGYGDVPTSVRAMKSGAVDFLTKPVKREVLLAAVKTALAHDAEARAVRKEARRWQDLFGALTEREREVFDLVVTGRLNKQIAAELGIAERTVKVHRGHVMSKMQADSLAHLVHIADLLQRSEQPHAQEI